MSLVLKSRARKSRSGKGRSGQQVVVVKEVMAPRGGAGGKVRARATRVARPISEATSAYKWALRDPFDDRAIGARIPDPFAVPTLPLKIETRFNLISDVSGNISGVFHPMLHSTLYLGQGTLSGGVLLPWDQNPEFFTISTDSASFGPSQFSQYRVVAFGIEFVNNLPPTTCTGRISMCPVPTSGVYPGPTTLDNAPLDPDEVYGTFLGTPVVSSDMVSELILSLPGSETVTMQELMTGPIQISCRPTGWDAYDWINAQNYKRWRTVGDTYGPAVGLTVDSSAPTAPTVIATDNETLLYCGRGWMALPFQATGLPASTSAIEVRIVYHLEGFPAIQAGSFSSAAASRPSRGTKPEEAVAAIFETAADKVIRFVSKKGTELAARGAGAVVDALLTKVGMRL